MKISGIIDESIVDGPGIRTVIFFQGCPHNCYKCHNPETHPFEGGQEMTLDQIEQVLENNYMVDGVTLSGGDPLANIENALQVARLVKQKFDKNLWIYSGYTYEEVLKLGEKDDRFNQILKYTDVLVDGKYLDNMRDLSLLYRGSTNQRLVDVPKSLELGKVIELKK